MTDLSLEVTATVPTNTTLTVWLYEDTGSTINVNSTTVANGTNSYTLSGYDGSQGNNIWVDWEAEGPVAEGATLDSWTTTQPTTSANASPVPASTSTAAASIGTAVSASAVPTSTSTSAAEANVGVAASASPATTSLSQASVTGVGVTALPVLSSSSTTTPTLSGTTKVSPMLASASVASTNLAAGTSASPVPASTSMEQGDVRSNSWLVEGLPTPAVGREGSTHDTLSLTFQGTKQQVEDTLRKLDENSGLSEKVVKSAGAFSHIDRSPTQGGNTYTLKAPSGRRSLRRDGEYVVLDYSEKSVDQAADRYEVSVDLGFVSERSYSGFWAQGYTVGPDEWLLTFDDGAITTDRVRTNTQRGSSKGRGSVRLTLTLTEDEARLVEESAAVPDAVYQFEVPDNGAESEDNSGGRQTLYIDPPGSVDSVSRGLYHVVGWEDSMINDDWFEMTLDLASAEWFGEPVTATTSLVDASVTTS